MKLKRTFNDNELLSEVSIIPEFEIRIGEAYVPRKASNVQIHRYRKPSHQLN